MTDDVLPTDEEAKNAVIRMLYKAVTQGGKTSHARFVCEHHRTFDPKKSPAGLVPKGGNSGGNVYHEIELFVVDSATVAAADKLMDRIEGKAKTQKPADPPPTFDASSLENLTDKQLEAILAAGPGVSASDD